MHSFVSLSEAERYFPRFLSAVAKEKNCSAQPRHLWTIRGHQRSTESLSRGLLRHKPSCPSKDNSLYTLERLPSADGLLEVSFLLWLEILHCIISWKFQIQSIWKEKQTWRNWTRLPRRQCTNMSWVQMGQGASKFPWSTLPNATLISKMLTKPLTKGWNHINKSNLCSLDRRKMLYRVKETLSKRSPEHKSQKMLKERERERENYPLPHPTLD